MSSKSEIAVRQHIISSGLDRLTRSPELRDVLEQVIRVEGREGGVVLKVRIRMHRCALRGEILIQQVQMMCGFTPSQEISDNDEKRGLQEEN